MATIKIKKHRAMVKRGVSPIGWKIKKARFGLGYKAKDVAKMLNVHASTISYYEQKDNSDLFVQYLMFLKRGGVNLNELF